MLSCVRAGTVYWKDAAKCGVLRNCSAVCFMSTACDAYWHAADVGSCCFKHWLVVQYREIC